jgi:hypothetical protein
MHALIYFALSTVPEEECATTITLSMVQFDQNANALMKLIHPLDVLIRCFRLETLWMTQLVFSTMSNKTFSIHWLLYL